MNLSILEWLATIILALLFLALYWYKLESRAIAETARNATNIHLNIHTLIKEREWFDDFEMRVDNALAEFDRKCDYWLHDFETGGTGVMNLSELQEALAS